MTGFLDRDGDAQGRPVGVTINRQGGLLTARDVGNRVWRVIALDRQKTGARIFRPVPELLEPNLRRAAATEPEAVSM